MGTQNFFFVPRSWKDEKTSLIISLLRSQTKLVGTLHQSNVFEVLSPSPTFKCCWLPTFLCHLAEPTHCYSCQMTKSRLHLRFRPLSARRWFAPQNSSRSAFFSAILYDLRSLHPGTCLSIKTPGAFRLKRAFPTRISKSASLWLCSWQADWTRPRKRLGYDFNFLSTASGTVDQCTMLTPSSETPRLILWSWSTNKTARWN